MAKSEHSEEHIISIYNETGSVWKTAKRLNRCGQTIHEYLSKRGLIKKVNLFTEDDSLFLQQNYLKYRDEGNLHGLAVIMNRTKNFICRKAKYLGLTGGYVKSASHIKNSIINANKWIDKEHPKGMLGKKHSSKVVADMAKRHKAAWADPNSIFNTPEHRQRLSDNMSKMQSNIENRSNNYSRTKKGWFVKDGILICMRSSWEFNYAHYLNYLVELGYILSWEYEPDTFKFIEIKSGIRTYTPDFKIKMINGDIVYHEVKGWMDEKSKTKLHYMQIYYPHISLLVIDKKIYKMIENMKHEIKGWGTWITSKEVYFRDDSVVCAGEIIKKYDINPRTEIIITVL